MKLGSCFNEVKTLSYLFHHYESNPKVCSANMYPENMHKMQIPLLWALKFSAFENKLTDDGNMEKIFSASTVPIFT